MKCGGSLSGRQQPGDWRDKAYGRSAKLANWDQIVEGSKDNTQREDTSLQKMKSLGGLGRIR